jgi:hypothetical protein
VEVWHLRPQPIPTSLPLPPLPTLAYRSNAIIATKSLAQRVHQGRLARAHGPTHPHSEGPLQIITLQRRLPRIKGTGGLKRLVGVTVLTVAVTMRMRMGVVGVRVFVGGSTLLLVVAVVVMGVVGLVVAVRVRMLVAVLVGVGVGVGVVACVVMVVVLMLSMPCEGRKRDQNEGSQKVRHTKSSLFSKVTYRGGGGDGAHAPPRLSRVVGGRKEEG